MRSLLIALILSCLQYAPCVAQTLAGYREDEVRTRMKGAALDPAEGLWEIAGEGTLVAIERAGGGPRDDHAYNIVAVNTSELAIAAGTVMGHLRPGADANVYSAEIFTGRDDTGVVLTTPKKFTAHLSADGRSLTVNPDGTSLRLNWWRLMLPYLYRSLISPVERHDSQLNGFRRVYPSPDPPFAPRYL